MPKIQKNNHRKIFEAYLESFSVINNLFDAICIFLLWQSKAIQSSIIVYKNIKIYLQTLFDPSVGRKSLPHTGKHSGWQQPLTIVEWTSVHCEGFLWDVREPLKNLCDPDAPSSALFYGDGKL